MDATDREIISLLQENARLSFSELGRRVRLSTNAVSARVRRLEDEGVIRGYTVLLGEHAPGPRGGLEVFVDVRLDDGVDGDVFLAALSPIDEVHEAIHVTGPYDHLVRAHVADTGALDRLLHRLKRDCGVRHTQTRIALRPTAPASRE